MVSYKAFFYLVGLKMLLGGDPLDDVIRRSFILFQEVSRGKWTSWLSGFAVGVNISFMQDQIPLKNIF